MFCRATTEELQMQKCEETDVSKSGMVEGKPVVLDTGRSRTLVHQSLVPKEKLLES